MKYEQIRRPVIQVVNRYLITFKRPNPSDSFVGSGVDLPHTLNLKTSLLPIPLIDTYRINPNL
jgi:hypothetical protein